MQNRQVSHRVGFGRSCNFLEVVARHSLTDMQQVLSLPITCGKSERDSLLLTTWVISGFIWVVRFRRF